jgi:hypothetical protein
VRGLIAALDISFYLLALEERPASVISFNVSDEVIQMADRAMLLLSTMLLFFRAVLWDILKIDHFLNIWRKCRVVYLSATL